MSEPGTPNKENFYFSAAPDLQGVGRPLNTGSIAQRPCRSNPVGMTGAQLRMYAWDELPEGHRNEVCRQIRMRCEAFISSARVQKSEWRSEVDRLVSEVVAHLLRATSIGTDESMMDCGNGIEARKIGVSSPLPWQAPDRTNNMYEPMRDARVIWIVNETCNRQALLHRYEDVRRRDRGGKWDGSSYPMVTVDDRTMEQLSGQYDPSAEETDSLQADDSRLAWEGLVHLIAHQFGAKDDIVALVQILASDRDTQESFGSQWPIGKIVRALNAHEPQKLWNDERVDNAKRRLAKFVGRLKQTHGLDAVDLRALLVRYAREGRATKVTPPRTS